MNVAMSGSELADAIREIDSQAVTDQSDDAVWVTAESWPDVATSLRDSEALSFEMLSLLKPRLCFLKCLLIPAE